jgi:hypothetical protein
LNNPEYRKHFVAKAKNKAALALAAPQQSHSREDAPIEKAAGPEKPFQYKEKSKIDIE